MIAVQQSNVFVRTVKKLVPRQKKDLDAAIKAIIKTAETGMQKKGDLVDVCVHEFRIIKQEILLALGPHENFYRDLKR